MCRLEFFGLHRRALLSSGGRIHRVSGGGGGGRLDRALGNGVAFTNLLHALPRPIKQLLSKWEGSAADGLSCPRLAAPVMPISSCCLASPRLVDHLQRARHASRDEPHSLIILREQCRSCRGGWQAHWMHVQSPMKESGDPGHMTSKGA